VQGSLVEDEHVKSSFAGRSGERVAIETRLRPERDNLLARANRGIWE
jgi:hypothetical protein